MNPPAPNEQLQAIPQPSDKKRGRGGIIALLFGLASVVIFFAAVEQNSCPTRARGNAIIARAVMVGFIAAMKGFETEYNSITPESFTIPSQKEMQRTRGTILKVLLGKEDKINPRNIPFFDPPPFRPDRKSGYQEISGEPILTDSWGEPYYYMLDLDGDGKIPNPDPSPAQPRMIPVRIIMFSSGPDRDPNTWKDNVVSWK